MTLRQQITSLYVMNCLNLIEWEQILIDVNPSICLSLFYEKLYEIIEKYVPYKKNVEKSKTSHE